MRTDMDDFAHRYGPVAVITGASSGIGRSFATQLATRKLDLVLVARRLDRLQQLAEELSSAHGVRVTAQQADLADPTAAAGIVDAVATLDVGLLVSNAGFGVKGAFELGEAGTLTDMMTVNCHTPTQLAHGLIPHLKQRGRGGILFTSSVEGFLGCPFSAGYSASKAYMTALGEALWGELTPLGLDVLTLCPGATDTEAPRLQGIDPADLHDLMSPDDVAASALEHLRHGPTHVPSEHYRRQFEQLLAMPRDQALTAMAKAVSSV
ncbi:SDR family NAD(P)-dependent oxidoreductase [Nocardia jiangxiensis]|uniref:SDR family NAD(P)-dependent oxidoreductase n=1 Tax=Nocardia jiangxiensis TaxID=282685 RepID=UPI000593631E|nr:SDR family NAD(P)-dependent oxidoreductase [Nocardia jiangxiensis]